MPRRNSPLLLALLLLTSSCYSTRSYTYLRAESALLPADSKVTSVLTSNGKWIPFDRLGGTVTHQRNAPNGSAGGVTGINDDGSVRQIPMDSVVAFKVSHEDINSHGTAMLVLTSLSAAFLLLVALIASAWSGSVG